MHIDKNHLYHGAALIQIAEDPHFTSINELEVGKKTYKDVFGINKNSAVFLKYGVNPTQSHKEYVFNFDKATRDLIKEVGEHIGHFVLALICVKLKEICCLTSEEFWKLINLRIKKKGEEEEQIQILVTAPKRKEFRVYVNAPGKKNTMAAKETLVPRSAFPSRVFPS